MFCISDSSTAVDDIDIMDKLSVRWGSYELLAEMFRFSVQHPGVSQGRKRLPFVPSFGDEIFQVHFWLEARLFTRLDDGVESCRHVGTVDRF